MLSLDEMIERETEYIRKHLELGSKFIRLRGKIRILRPYDIEFLKGQTDVHNIFMKEGHSWKVDDVESSIRKCTVCHKRQILAQDGIWVSTLVNSTLTQEDVFELILRSSQYDLYWARKQVTQDDLVSILSRP